MTLRSSRGTVAVNPAPAYLWLFHGRHRELSINWGWAD